jgi:hypothetical protein
MILGLIFDKGGVYWVWLREALGSIFITNGYSIYSFLEDFA